MTNHLVCFKTPQEIQASGKSCSHPIVQVESEEALLIVKYHLRQVSQIPDLFSIEFEHLHTSDLVLPTAMAPKTAWHCGATMLWSHKP